MPDRGHRLLPHTADVIVEAWASDLAACVEEAVAGVLDGCIEAPDARIVGVHTARLGPGTAESLLLDALDELVFVLDTSADVPVRAAVHPADGDGHLEVAFSLAEPSSVTSVGAGPKAISRSGLTVEASPGAVHCRFLVDV